MGERPAQTGRKEHSPQMVTCWSHWVALAAGLLAALLSTTRLALNGFTGGRLRRLEARHAALAARVERHLQRREEYRVLLRLLAALAVVSAAASLEYAAGRAGAGCGLGLGGRVALVAGGVLFVLVTEGFGRHLGPAASAGLLAAVLPVVDALALLTFPLSYPVLFLHRQGRRWRDARAEEHAEGTTEDEILSLLEEDAASAGSEPGIEPEERRMIRGILDLDETTASDIMTPRVDVDGIDEQADVSAGRAFIVRSGHSRIPVYRETIDHITGIVYAKDLLDDQRAPPGARLGDLAHPPLFVPASKRVGDLLKEFQQSRNHLAVVLDEYGGTAGIVTIEDILEEIVGEIRDEYDTEDMPPLAQPLPDGSMLVDARTSIEAVNEALGAGLPTDEDYDTVGGYISAEAGRIPEVGETVTTRRLVAEIIQADPRRILKARIRVRTDEHDDEPDP